MLDEKVKLEEYMKNEIQRVSGIQIDKLEEEIRQIRSQTTSSLEENAKMEAELQKENELREMQSEYAIALSRLHEETNRKLMDKRTELNEAIFDEVKARMMTFCTQEQYKLMLKEKVSKLAKEYPHDGVVIEVAKKDEAILEELCNTYQHGCTGATNDDITIGGFLLVCKEQGIVIDETFDTAISEQREWFYANSGLFIK